MVSSDHGDGFYPSCFLYAADGSLSCLLTDFCIMEGIQWDAPLSQPIQVPSSQGQLLMFGAKVAHMVGHLPRNERKRWESNCPFCYMIAEADRILYNCAQN